ncbi:glycosyltransferase [Hymenobacter arizonensis]|uniref:Glycosyltransferase, catalytic subunit of cellulose synthase and poly-beta-1,6-N-acetylglucosamine synthase n=1 Tax=Hymenobacter arizonensis TaxID=1227077 RepID=A0A1I5SI29_HYMAR|nr:glycosyltransferase [Hymenobacter arizonensis]SFP70424.1 Glycosyltransferase, catalytic subunit of cellulose synthase and poly-beta-1,6-N-acetylglucosamine synthase [Hymenobacter arizonensis]
MSELVLLLSLSFLAVWLLGMAYATWCFATRRGAKPAGALPAPLPRVSVLIAARDEAAALPRCLASLRALHYPPELIEVLLGDDASSDGTAAVAAAAMQGYKGQFRVVTITATLGEARGKANVLAHLAKLATTEYFFVTDADISVPPTWISGLLAHTGPGVGTVTGITAVRGPRLFHRLQGIDWLLSLSMVQVVSDLGRPVTAMGNNMLVTRAAYEATGGYEALPFSVTEDFALFKATLEHGYGFRNVYAPETRADSLPIFTWTALMKQRRRWLKGVEALPLRLRLELLFFSGFWPALAGVAVLAGPGWALGIWGLKVLVQGSLAHFAHRRAGLRLAWHLLPLFELYTIALTFGLVGYRMLNTNVVWKGRRYD